MHQEIPRERLIAPKKESKPITVQVLNDDSKCKVTVQGMIISWNIFCDIKKLTESLTRFTDSLTVITGQRSLNYTDCHSTQFIIVFRTHAHLLASFPCLTCNYWFHICLASYAA